MSFILLDTRFYDTPQVIMAGNRATGLFVKSLCYTSANKTGGFISKPAAMSLMSDCCPKTRRKTIAKMLSVDFWHTVDGGYQVTPSTLWQIASDQRLFDAMRKSARNIANEIFERDEYTCVYCGATERLTLDHVTALSRGGDNSRENLVTACRSCNSSKGAKKVEDWITQ